MWRSLAAISRKVFFFETNTAVCQHENSAEPHSPHSFVTVHIHSVANSAQQWQRTKNVQRQKRVDEECQENKTCGSCFPLLNRPQYPGDRKCLCTTVNPQVDVSRTWMTASFLYLDLDIMTQSHYLKYFNTYHCPSHWNLQKTTHRHNHSHFCTVGHDYLCSSLAIFL